jgi:hypothetical protein
MIAFYHKLFIYTPGEKQGLYPIFKNWFIIDSKVLRVPLGPLFNLATEYALVCPLGGLFQF